MMAGKTVAISLIWLFIIFGGADAKTHIRNKRIKFPPTLKVDLLLTEPETPFVSIGTIELKGNSIIRTFIEVIKEGRKIGADAIIPAKNSCDDDTTCPISKFCRAEDQSGNGSVLFVIKVQAIKYKSSIQSLLKNGVKIKYEIKPFSFGVQANIMPYILKGYNISSWIGKNNLRLKGNVYRLNIPQTLLDHGYQNGKIEASYGLSVDYFLNNNFQGIWFSLGFEYRQGSLEHALEADRGKFKKIIHSLEIGYNRYFTRNFYIGTTFAGNFLIDGDKNVRVGQRTAHFYQALPWMTFVFGWQY